tara:strand:+ start:4433 stop:4636 length:204 start_codon:yes stop_codon:yes gene_type:complete
MTKQQYQELFNTLTPRMQKQLIEYATQLENEQQALNNFHNDKNYPYHDPADEPEHGDFIIKGNTLYL